jgi:multidrug efflux pump subunit AcrB
VKRAVAWFAENHVAANLLMVLIVVAGLAALPTVQQKSFPDIDIEVIQIGVTYLGASPEEVEEGVCIRIEEAIQATDGIEKLTSTATEGACGVSAELIPGYPVDRALSEIKNNVDAITTFPVETEKPIVSHYQIRRNALQLALSGEASEEALKLLGEQVRDEITALPGVTQVELEATRNYEISIEVPEESLQRHGLTFDEVVRAVRRGSLDRPGGSIKTDAGEVLLRAKGQAYSGREFDEIVVLTRDDGTRLLLRDVATVIDGFEEDEHYARFDGEPAVLVKVYRVGDQRVLDLVAEVKEYVAGAAAALPEGVDLTVWRDGSRSLRDRLDILIRSGVSGFVLVFVVLALFLRLRLAFWVSLGIPISFLGALTLFPVFDVSIDLISLFAFILVLGILVDDAIVVGENVHRHQEEGDEPLDSAIRGAQEVAIPVTFGVLTTIAAFLPMILAPGHMGQVFGAIGIVVVFCLLFSWVESKLILPSHLGHMRIGEKAAGESAEPSASNPLSSGWRSLQAKVSGGLVRFVRNVYRPALERALEWRYATLSAGVATLIVTVAVIASGTMKFSFFPPVDGDFVSARLTMPQGVPVALTEQAVLEIEAAARRVKDRLDAEYPDVGVVRHILTKVGAQPGSSSRGSTNPSGGTHLGGVEIELVGGDDRPLSAGEIAQLWREETPEIAGAEELVFKSALFSVGEPINLEFQARDVAALQAASDALKARLADYPGVFDISDSFRDGKEEIKLTILETAQPLGLTLADLADQVRQAFYGEEAQRIQRGRDDVRVMVRYPESGRRSLADLENLRIRTPDGGEVPFYTVARAERGRGYANIRRRDRQRVINVTADLDEEEANANEIMRDLRESFLPGLLADHPGVQYVVEGVQREQAEALKGLLFNYLFALVLIYALLAIPLRSYGQPLIIMAVIPFGLVGAIAGHLLLGHEILSMMSVFGVVALSGVIVNDSLVLVHYVNERRRDGVALLQAVRDAGEARFRPILLTSLTTFAGLTPLLLERSLSAQFLIPMAISLGFGVLFGTLISLFLVPSSYVILEDVKRLFGMKPPAPPRQADVAPLRPVSGVRR